MFDFSDEQVERYSRHIILPEVGGEGQSVLLGSKVLLVGAGGLGSPAAYYLAAAGIGNMGIIDFDTVDLSNLQRQIIHNTELCIVDDLSLQVTKVNRIKIYDSHVTDSCCGKIVSCRRTQPTSTNKQYLGP